MSIENFGLKVDYRHHDLKGNLSIVSFQAFSTCPNWSMLFELLVSDTDLDKPYASAVLMQKYVKVVGVHFIMISPKMHSDSLPVNNLGADRSEQDGRADR